MIRPQTKQCDVHDSAAVAGRNASHVLLRRGAAVALRAEDVHQFAELYVHLGTKFALGVPHQAASAAGQHAQC